MGLKWVCPSTALVSRDLSYGSVIRHIQRLGESIDDIEQKLGCKSPPRERAVSATVAT
jgi:hypothetical protein